MHSARHNVSKMPSNIIFLQSYDFVIGGSYGPPNPNGFTGCLRAFMINGLLQDLVTHAKKAAYGEFNSTYF